MSERDKHPQRWKDFSAYIAAELVAIGKPKGIRQKQIADAMGVHPSQMSLYVNGRRGLITSGHLVAACDLLDVKPQDVIKVAYAKLGDGESGGGNVTPLRPDAPMSDPDDTVVGEPIAAQTRDVQSEFEHMEGDD